MDGSSPAQSEVRLPKSAVTACYVSFNAARKGCCVRFSGAVKFTIGKQEAAVALKMPKLQKWRYGSVLCFEAPAMRIASNGRKAKLLARSFDVVKSR